MSINKRYDFTFIFDVKDGNPNGDPDAGNMPRIDPETGDGLVTDVCIKRKIRNYVQLLCHGEEGKDIFVKEGCILNDLIVDVYDSENKNQIPQNPKDKLVFEKNAETGMCKKYFDVRTFGAVMTTGDKETIEDNEEENLNENKKKKASTFKKTAGRVCGPVQITFSRSVEPIVAFEHSITRMAVTNIKDLEKKQTFGNKFTVPYGLYRGNGFVSANLAAKTLFSDNDLELLWTAIQNMFEYDRSAAKGLMVLRRLVVFEHSSALGDKPAHELFERVSCKRTTDGPARDFKDYLITVDGKETKDTFLKLQAKG